MLKSALGVLKSALGVLKPALAVSAQLWKGQFLGRAFFWRDSFLGRVVFGKGSFLGRTVFWEGQFLGRAVFGGTVFWKGSFLGRAGFWEGQSVLFVAWPVPDIALLLGDGIPARNGSEMERCCFLRAFIVGRQRMGWDP